MVSWGPTRADGEKFYSGQKNAPPWVRDLNWKHQCHQETQQLENRKAMKAMMGTTTGSSSSSIKGGRTTKGRKIRTKIGSHGAIVPDEPDDVLLEMMAFQKETKRPGQRFVLQSERRGNETNRSQRSRRSNQSGCGGIGGGGGGGEWTARSSCGGRSTGRSSARSMSTIGSINTEMREIIRDTAAAEISALKDALSEEAKLRAASDAKIDRLCSELAAMRKSNEREAMMTRNAKFVVD